MTPEEQEAELLRRLASGELSPQQEAALRAQLAELQAACEAEAEEARLARLANEAAMREKRALQMEAAMMRNGRHEAVVEWWDGELGTGVAKILVRDGMSRLVANPDEVGAVWDGDENGEVFVHVTRQSLLPADGSYSAPGAIFAGMHVSLYLDPIMQKSTIRIPAPKCQSTVFKDTNDVERNHVAVDCYEAANILRADGKVLSAVAAGKDYGMDALPGPPLSEGEFASDRLFPSYSTRGNDRVLQPSVSRFFASTQTFGSDGFPSEPNIYCFSQTSEANSGGGSALQASRSQVSIPRPRLAQLATRTEFHKVRPPIPLAEAASDTHILVALKEGLLGGVLRCAPLHAKQLDTLVEAFGGLLLLQDNKSSKKQQPSKFVNGALACEVLSEHDSIGAKVMATRLSGRSTQ